MYNPAGAIFRGIWPEIRWPEKIQLGLRNGIPTRPMEMRNG
jgi:hypothetical protein